MITSPVAFYMRPVNCSQRELWLKWASVKVTHVCLLLSGLWICASVLIWFSLEVLSVDCLTCCSHVLQRQVVGPFECFASFLFSNLKKITQVERELSELILIFLLGKKCYFTCVLVVVALSFWGWSVVWTGTCSWTMILLFLSKEVAGKKASVVGLIPSPKPVSLLEPKGIYLYTWWFASFHRHGF